MQETRDYRAWHRQYEDASSGLSWPLGRVRHHLDEALSARPGELRVVSVCAGDGRDVIGVLAGRDDTGRVSATLLEIDPALSDRSRAAAAAAGLDRVDVRTVDAGRTGSYRDLAPADVVLLVGIFGNITDTDVWRLLAFAPRLCRPGAALLWSRGRRFGHALPGVTRGDLNPEVRAHLVAGGFVETGYETHDEDGLPAIGVAVYEGTDPAALEPGPLFTFLR